jgi:hypothetical protein
MGERQKLQSNLKRYLIIRDLISDELVVAVIEELIRETEDRLTQLDNELGDQRGRGVKGDAAPLKEPNGRVDGQNTIRAYPLASLFR